MLSNRFGSGVGPIDNAPTTGRPQHQVVLGRCSAGRPPAGNTAARADAAGAPPTETRSAPGPTITAVVSGPASTAPAPWLPARWWSRGGGPAAGWVWPTYSAVKAAASALFTATAKEAQRSKIRVLDIRPPHTGTGLADRAIAGDPPRMPEGADPDAVADRIVAALVGDERDLPSSAFS